MSPEEYKSILAKYLPHAAVDPVYAFMSRHNVFFHITRKRTSKLGDYRWPQPRHNYQEISVNGDMNPYQFLMVLLHEMAHLNTHQRHGNEVQPHGHEWQGEYRQLLLQYLPCFPNDIASLIISYTSRIPLSRTIEKQIDAQLRRYDPDYSPSNDLTLNQLAPGTAFRIAANPQKSFRALEKRRTRWICLGLDDNKKYLVSGTAQVILI
ncbi:MAG: SprT-like domain-containing protein [Bacteroidales bacterium]|nr:SprT-like domain-containing protein [Bacteroidales bacterium]